MRYRAEIDGLRALAILPVVGFHAGFSWLPGGFTGVDVFFVISGYLITGLILDEIQDGTFSVLEFYKRRALRILPALTVVLLATAVVAFIVMLPNEFVATGRSIVAAALFVSNIHFWQEAGYFATAASLRPALHTWSLAVEEQFYLFFPLALLVIARWLDRKFLLWIGLCVAASFLLSIVATPRAPSASFYLLPTRVWELGIGALVAAGGAPRLNSVRLRATAAWLGLVLLAWGVVGISEESTFPGWNALFPCLGAGLIIAYGAGTGVGAILSRTVTVWIGRISYSLYLWHWPLIVFYGMVYGQKLDLRDQVAVIAGSIALAALSYRFVESPFRTVAFRSLPAPRVLWPAVASIAGCVAAGGAIATTGLGWRSYPPDVLQIAKYTDYIGTPDQRYQFGGNRCSTSGYHGGEPYDREACLKIVPGKKNVLIIGDSHADAVWRAITLAFPDINFLKTSVSGCRPLLDADGEAPCRETNNFVLRDFLGKNRLDGAILAGRWRETDFPKVEPTLEYLKKHVGRIVVFGPTVEYEGAFPILLARERLNGIEDLTESAMDEQKKRISDQLGRIVSAEGVTYIPVFDVICPNLHCIETTKNGVPLQFDYGHLTLQGSELLIDHVKDRMHL